MGIAYLREREAVEIFGVSRMALRNWGLRGKLRKIKNGSKVRWKCRFVLKRNKNGELAGIQYLTYEEVVVEKANVAYAGTNYEKPKHYPRTPTSMFKPTKTGRRRDSQD